MNHSGCSRRSRSARAVTSSLARRRSSDAQVGVRRRARPGPRRAPRSRPAAGCRGRPGQGRATRSPGRRPGRRAAPAAAASGRASWRATASAVDAAPGAHQIQHRLVGQQPARRSRAPRPRRPRRARSRSCAAWPRGSPSRRTGTEPLTAVIGKAPTRVCQTRYSVPAVDLGRRGSRRWRRAARGPASAHSAGQLGRARPAGRGRPRERLVSWVDSVVIGGRASALQLLRARRRAAPRAATPMRAGSPPTSLSATQPEPAVERGVLDALGHHRPAGLLEAHDELVPACGPDRSAAPGRRPAGRGRGRAPGRGRRGVSSGKLPEGLGRGRLARPRPTPAARARRARRRRGSGRTRRAARPRSRAGRGGCGRAARGRSWQMLGQQVDQPVHLGVQAALDDLALGLLDARRPVRRSRRSSSLGQRRQRLARRPGRRTPRRPGAARRSPSCPRTASRPAASRPPSRIFSTTTQAPPVAVGQLGAGSRAGRPGRPGGRSAGRRPTRRRPARAARRGSAAKTSGSSTPHGDQRVDVEEPPVVELLVADPPVRQPVVLPVEQLGQRQVLGARAGPGRRGRSSAAPARRPSRSAGRSSASSPAASTCADPRPEHRHQDARPGRRPVDVEPARRTATPGPSRSTDHSAALCQAGVGTAMWLGTTSTTTPRPGCVQRRRPGAANAVRARRARRRDRAWSTTS